MAVELTDLTIPIEREFDADHALPLLRPTVTAFIGRTQRGPIDEAVLIKSFDEFRRIFGGHSPLGFTSHAVLDYFLHGGETAAVVRVANRATRATLELPAGGERLRLQARQPGSHEFLRVSVDYDRVESEPSRFNLVVQRLSRPGSQLVEDQEFFQAISIDRTQASFVVDALRESELVRLSGPLPTQRPDATSAKHPGEPIPYLTMTAPGTDGEELTDYDIIGSNEEKTGLFALDALERMDLLCIPSPPGRDLGVITFLAAERYCQRRRGMLIWDAPASWTGHETAIMSLRSGELASRNAISYFPRVRVRGTADRPAAGLPACGAMAGILASGDRWGHLQHQQGSLKGGRVPVCDLGAREAARLHRYGVNTFARVAPGIHVLAGNVSLAGAKSMSSLDPRLDQRRLVLFIQDTLERGTRWARHGPHDVEHWAQLERQVSAFFDGLRAQGALAGERREDSYFLRRLPAAQQEDGFAFRVGFALRKGGEFLTFDVEHREARSVAREVAPLELGQLAG